MYNVVLQDCTRHIYLSLMGSLQDATVCTRPYVSTALSILGSAQAHPTEAHIQALNKVICYLHGTLNLRVTL
jgi:hypothetical protein